MEIELSDQMVHLLANTVIALIRRDGADLTARQIAVFLTCYVEREAQTVRGLAVKLNISRPAVSRALDRLCDFDLVHRKTDPTDGRSILVQRTATGTAFFRDLKAILMDAREEISKPLYHVTHAAADLET